MVPGALGPVKLKKKKGGWGRGSGMGEEKGFQIDYKPSCGACFGVCKNLRN